MESAKLIQWSKIRPDFLGLDLDRQVMSKSYIHL